jgi:hypothetical protein
MALSNHKMQWFRQGAEHKILWVRPVFDSAIRIGSLFKNTNSLGKGS